MSQPSPDPTPPATVPQSQAASTTKTRNAPKLTIRSVAGNPYRAEVVNDAERTQVVTEVDIFTRVERAKYDALDADAQNGFADKCMADVLERKLVKDSTAHAIDVKNILDLASMGRGTSTERDVSSPPSGHSGRITRSQMAKDADAELKTPHITSYEQAMNAVEKNIGVEGVCFNLRRRRNKRRS